MDPKLRQIIGGLLITFGAYFMYSYNKNDPSILNIANLFVGIPMAIVGVAVYGGRPKPRNDEPAQPVQSPPQHQTQIPEETQRPSKSIRSL